MGEKSAKILELSQKKRIGKNLEKTQKSFEKGIDKGFEM